LPTPRRNRSAKKSISRKNGAPKTRRPPARTHIAKPVAHLPESLAIDWIRPLADPYLRGFRAKAERSNGLRGFYFTLSPRRAAAGAGAKNSLGFFVGFLTAAENFAHLKPAAPECLIFAFIEPVGGALHRAQVRDAQGALLWTSTYIRWLTHRPPRFEFYESQRTALIRHASMQGWPVEKIQHFAGNFFTETLAWLVRSGLVQRWRDLSGVAVKQ
jgi:hypothetical protein